MKLLKSFLLGCLLISGHAFADTAYNLKSPDTSFDLTVTVGKQVSWSLDYRNDAVLAPSTVALKLQNGEFLGESPSVISSATTEAKNTLETNNYTRSQIVNSYNQLELKFEGGYTLQFRAYDEAIAYRFVTERKGDLIIQNEVAEFNFTEDREAFIPYMEDYRDGKIFNCSFESLYEEVPLSKLREGSYAILPLLVELDEGRKAVILEADLENYPGMLIDLNEDKEHGLVGAFAPYPLETKVGGYSNFNTIPTKRADYIAKVSGQRTFPWRIMVISDEDKDLLDIDIVQKLSSPCRIEDTSWIKPGQVAWDWWNDFYIWGVDFEVGRNTETYKHYIDFASENGIAYIILDEGWSAETDLMEIAPNMDVEALVEYGKEHNVGIILWATWHTVLAQMEDVFPYYSKMGVKGFKIDFVDRDDQIAVASLYDIAAKAAEHHFILDYHGVFKPTGLQSTYPNVLNYEGVKGLENVKWGDENYPRYAVSIPYIRMMAGPMDYTPGAMRNSIQANYHPSNSYPMSKGTRCHQIAMYVVYEAPLQMLADSPSMYRQEQETTNFITKVPTVFDDTVALDGKVGEYLALARKSGDSWFVAAMTNWESRDLELDLSFLPEGKYQMVIFKDGINAERVATDYVREEITVNAGDKINIHLAQAGGWAARIEKR